MSSDSVTLLGYSRCSTCRNARRWLEDAGVEAQFYDMVEKPPSKEELRRLVERSGRQMRKFFNTSGQRYREMGLKDQLPGMSEEEMLTLLVSDGMLIKRPLLTDGKRTLIGFRKGEYEEWLAAHQGRPADKQEQ